VLHWSPGANTCSGDINPKAIEATTATATPAKAKTSFG
jgi:hypothetical protein